MQVVPGTHRFRQISAAFFAILLAAAASVGVSVPAHAASGDGASGDAATCAVAGSTLSWGVKKSFRDYISGPIASGSWATSGAASYASGTFTWSAGTGEADETNSAISVEYSGGIHFVGHAGALDLTLANPTLSIASPTVGYLLVDVTSGSATDEQVSFARLNLTGVDLTATGGVISLSSVPATLTSDGAAAFIGFYPTGEALDPVSATVPVSTTDCTDTPDDTSAADASISLAPVVNAAKKTVSVTVVGEAFGSVSRVSSAIVESGTESPLVSSRGSSRVSTGTFTQTLTVAIASWSTSKTYAVVVWAPTSESPTNATTYATQNVTLTRAQTAAIVAAQKAASDASTEKPSASNSTKTGSPTKTTGKLTWGVSTSFRKYVVGPIAKGAITTTSNVSTTTSTFTFPQKGASTYTKKTHTGSVQYVGTVTFSGHSGLMELTVKNPRIEVVSATKAHLYVANGGSDVLLATLALPTPTTSASGAVTFTNAKATLTSAGLSQVFQGYQPSSGLDPVTFTLGSSASASATSSTTTTTVATAATSATATSTRTTTSTKTSAAATTQTVAGCSVSGATLTWGVKESFRGYIDGSIANGSWSEKGNASYDTPNFSWKKGTGGLDRDASTATVAFTGSVNFTGHQGVLNLTLANPTLSIVDASTGYLLLDVKNTTMDGASVNEKQVSFVKLDLSGVSLAPVDGVVTLTAVPATLTAEGSAAFGTYPEGEAFDAVTLSIPVATDCTTSASPTASQPSASDVLADASASTGAGQLPMAAYAGVAVLLLALGGAGGWVLARRSGATASAVPGASSRADTEGKQE